MKRFTLLLLSCICYCAIILAQPSPKAYKTTFANKYKLPFGVTGDCWFEKVSPLLKEKPATYYSTGLWLGGFNPEGNLLGAFPTYTQNGYDFIAGPIDLSKNEAERTLLAKLFDKIWSVTSYEIATHRADLMDGKLDNPIPSIMAWAGRGNPYFEQYNGFKNEYLMQDLAPFKDVDKDGIYNPAKGDFPMTPQTDENNLPDELFWSVFNDNSGHSGSKGKPLFFEIQQTVWNFACSDNPQLNNTNFQSFKIINKGKENIDSLFMGYWADVDLGCYQDDYVGCSPKDNTFFAYNQDDFDGASNQSILCPGGVVTFKEMGIPSTSITFLNRPMYAFMSYNSSSFLDFPPATTDPSLVSNFYHYLNGVWKDGVPMTKGGNGYNPTSKDTTKFAYDGNPNDSTTWNMKSTKRVVGDMRGVGSTYLKSLAPNQSTTIDLALAFHQDTTKKTTLAQVDYMYSNLGKIQNAYNQRFTNKCKKENLCSQSDCVFPGDANNDGRADIHDFLTIAQNTNKKGSIRGGSIIWEAKNATNWTENSRPNVNLKHADCDGDGEILTLKDKLVLSENYGKVTTSFKAKSDVYKSGNEVVFNNPATTFDSLKISSVANNLLYKIQSNFLPADSIAGFACQIEYDKEIFSSVTAAGNNQYIFVQNFNPFLLNESHLALFGNSGSILFNYLPEIKSTNKTPKLCTEIRFKNIRAIRKDGTFVENIGGRDMTFCFNPLLLSEKTIQINLDISIFPNPFENQFTITNNASQNIDYQLIDLQGRILKTGNVLSQNTQQIATDFLPQGVYLIKIQGEDGRIEVRKLVKTNF